MSDTASIRWNQVKELFAAASEMTATERKPFLARIREEDNQVRVEVERLLKQYDRMGSFLELESDRDSLIRLFEFQIFSPGDIVSGRFKVIRFIGRGGMGEVYEADDQTLERKVALKTIRPEIAADERTIARFKQEIQLALKVTHRNVCRVYDIESEKRSVEGVESEIAYLKMELLPGENLEERLRRSGRMTTEEALPIICQIATGLQAAHDAGIVHGDLKSSNVVLVPLDDGGCRAVVTDFGLARLVSATTGEIGALFGGTGTPAYMAPEQVARSAVTKAADIYSLGIIMFEMVTGMLPFIADTPTKIAEMRLDESAPPPRSIVSDLDPRWNHAISRCLERNPLDRFHSSAEVACSLQPSTWFHWTSRSRKVLLSIATCILVGSSSVAGYAIWKASTPKHKIELAETRFRDGLQLQSAGDRQRAEAAFEEAQRLYQSAGNMAGVAEALIKQGDFSTDEGDFARARSSYQSALAIAQGKGDEERVGIALTNLGFMLGRQGDVAGKRKSYESALNIFRKTGDKRRIATILKNLGNLESGANSRMYYEQALTIFNEIGYKPGAASTLDDLGGVLDANGYLTAARRAFEEELSMWSEVSDKSFVGASVLAKYNLGCVLYEQGHLLEGKRQFEDSLRLSEEVKATIQPGLLSALGELLLQQGELVQARKVTEQALALAYKSGSHGDIGGARLTMARVAMEEWHPAEAESQAKLAAEQFRMQGLSLDEVRSSAVLALAFVAERKVRDARNILKAVLVPGIKKELTYGDRLALMIAAGRVLSATESAPDGLKYLRSALDDSKRLGYLGPELEARMALAEIEMRAGQLQSRSLLAEVEGEATANGFSLIARKARRIMKFGKSRPN